MKVILKHELYHIKNGFAAHSPELGLTTHGYSAELARRNLERTAFLFLKPFERQGVLDEEIRKLRLESGGNEVELTVVTSE